MSEPIDVKAQVTQVDIPSLYSDLTIEELEERLEMQMLIDKNLTDGADYLNFNNTTHNSTATLRATSQKFF